MLVTINEAGGLILTLISPVPRLYEAVIQLGVVGVTTAIARAALVVNVTEDVSPTHMAGF